MKKQKKFLAVLSAAAVSTMIAAAVSTTAFAKTTDVIAKIDGQEVKINFEELTTAYENKAAGLDSELFNKYNEREGLTALLDDKNGFVDYKAVQEAAEDAVALGEKFVLNDFTETTEKTLADFKPEAEWKDDKVVPVTPVEEGLKVESVSAINAKTVDVNINVDLDEIAVEDVVVTNQDGERKYIKSVGIVGADGEVKVAAAGKSTKLRVEFYDALKSGDTYTFTVDVDGEKVSADLEFEIGEPAEIKFDEQVIPNNGNLDYKVLDANGLDITSTTKVKVSSDKSVFTASEGKVETTLASAYAFVELSYTNKDGDVVKSKRVKVTAEAEKPVEFASNWTLAKTSAEPNYKADDYKQDKTLNMGTSKYLDIELVDQFGERFANETSVKYETLDASVAIVDEVSGKVTPRKEGKALVKASIIGADNKVVASKTVELNVVGEAKLAGVEVDSNAIDVTANFTNKVKVTLVDQFGNSIEGNVKVEIADTKVATVSPAGASVRATDGKLELTVTGVKEGNTNVKVTSGEFSETITVNVVEAGEVADYDVDGFASELLIKDVDSKDADKMTLKVKAVDANGLTKEVLQSGYEVEVKDKNDTVVSLADTNKADGITITSTELDSDAYEGPFTVTVKVGDLTIFSDEFVVTDNRVAPKYKVQGNKVTISSTPVNAADLFEGVLDFADVDGKSVAINDVEFVTSNEKVIKIDEEGVISSEEDGTTSIYVDTVTVFVDEDGNGQYDDGEDKFKIDLNGMKVDVTVDTFTDIIAPDTVVVPENEDLVFKVSTTDSNPYSLEVDHSLEGTLPEFTIYADSKNVWGSEDASEQAKEAKVSAEFDAENKEWTITFEAGSLAYNAIKDKASNGGFNFYTVVKDTVGNVSGHMGLEDGTPMTAPTTTVTFE